MRNAILKFVLLFLAFQPMLWHPLLAASQGDTNPKGIGHLPDQIEKEQRAIFVEQFAKAIVSDIESHDLQISVIKLMTKIDRSKEFPDFVKTKSREEAGFRVLSDAEMIIRFLRSKGWGSEIEYSWMNLTLNENLTWSQGVTACRVIESQRPKDLFPAAWLLWKSNPSDKKEWVVWADMVKRGLSEADSAKLKAYYIHIYLLKVFSIANLKFSDELLKELHPSLEKSFLENSIRKYKGKEEVVKLLARSLATTNLVLREYSKAARYAREDPTSVGAMLETMAYAFARDQEKAKQALTRWRELSEGEDTNVKDFYQKLIDATGKQGKEPAKSIQRTRNKTRR